MPSTAQARGIVSSNVNLRHNSRYVNKNLWTLIIKMNHESYQRAKTDENLLRALRNDAKSMHKLKNTINQWLSNHQSAMPLFHLLTTSFYGFKLGHRSLLKIDSSNCPTSHKRLANPKRMDQRYYKEKKIMTETVQNYVNKNI